MTDSEKLKEALTLIEFLIKGVESAARVYDRLALEVEPLLIEGAHGLAGLAKESRVILEELRRLNTR